MDHGDDPVMKMYEAQAIAIEKETENKQLKERIEELEKKTRELESRNQVWAAIRTIQERLETDFAELFTNKTIFAERVDLLEMRQEANEKIIQDRVEKIEQLEERLGEIASQQRAESDEKLAITTCTAVLSERINSVEEKLNINGGTILLLGGRSSNNNDVTEMLILNRNELKWSTLSIKLPCKNSYGGAVCFKEEMYIFGGTGLKNKLYKLDRQMKWIELAAMNETRTTIQSSCLVFQGCIWVFGGWTGTKALKTVEKEMKEARSGAVAGVLNGKIIVCGGGDGKFYLKSVECYDPTSEIWTPLADMPGPRAAHAGISVGSCLTVFGGEDGTDLSSCWRANFDVEEGRWNEMLPMKERRTNCSASLIGNEIFAIGGLNGKTPLKSVEIFDGRAWRNGPQLPNGIFEIASVRISQTLANVLCHQ